MSQVITSSNSEQQSEGSELVKQLSFGPSTLLARGKSTNHQIPFVESLRGSSQDYVDSPKFGNSSAYDSNDGLPNVVDASSSGSKKKLPTKKQNAKSAFYGKGVTMLSEESDDEPSR